MAEYIWHDNQRYWWNAIHNSNGSWHCNDCGYLVILFDDDTHDCWKLTKEQPPVPAAHTAWLNELYGKD